MRATDCIPGMALVRETDYTWVALVRVTEYTWDGSSESD